MIYLAGPYSHPNVRVRLERYRAACRETAELRRAGHVVYSPIAQSHPLVEFGLPTSWEFWERFDQSHLERCDEVVVLMQDGWQESTGVQAEVRLARDLNIPVRYVEVGCAAECNVGVKRE